MFRVPTSSGPDLELRELYLEVPGDVESIPLFTQKPHTNPLSPFLAYSLNPPDPLKPTYKGSNNLIWFRALESPRHDFDDSLNAIPSCWFP